MRRWVALGLVSVLLFYGCATDATPQSGTGSQSDASPPVKHVPEVRYHVDSGSGTIDQAEADQRPPIDRWPVLKALSDTTSIHVTCHPNGTQIQDAQVIAEIVDLMQKSTYIPVDGSQNDPDLKIYFLRSDKNFIMAARVSMNRSYLESPEGPEIKTNPILVDRLLADGTCKRPK